LWLLGSMLFLSALINAKITTDQFRVHGLSSFNSEQQKMLTKWLSTGVNATRSALGVYPRVLELYVYPRKSNQPVPWAHTRRDENESIHFYIDTRFPLEKFVKDWTIYHEMAHLALPYLGSDYSWFSEGFASFMQYQIMLKAEVLEGSAEQRYQQKISPHLRWFNSDLAAAEVARRLMAKKNYPAGYWGGAYFFVLANQQLTAKHNTSLIQVIESYQECCRLKDKTIQDVVQSLDRIIQGKLFSELLRQYQEEPARSLYPETFN
jgi:hypothetical protein